MPCMADLPFPLSLTPAQRRQRLWLFNPENDIALAAGSGQFTPPKAALDIRRAGALLPLFLAQPGDAVYCEGVNSAWFDTFCERFSISADIWDHNDFNLWPEPWGWSESVRRQFIHLGISPSMLPTKATLEHYRQLSHRRTAAKISLFLASIFKDNPSAPQIWPAAIEIFDIDQLTDFIGNSDTIVAKLPWSSSGRGVTVFNKENDDLETFLSRTKGSIRRQGSVMTELYMHDCSEFAFLFICHDGSAEFFGTSVFSTESKSGRYIGNMVDTQSSLQHLIDQQIGSDISKLLIDGLKTALNSIISPSYSGPVGVDICFSIVSGLPMIHICELNLRYTMGFVAAAIARHSNEPGLLTYINKPAALLPKNAISLTPPGNPSSFILLPQ